MWDGVRGCTLEATDGPFTDGVKEKVKKKLREEGLRDFLRQETLSLQSNEYGACG